MQTPTPASIRTLEAHEWQTYRDLRLRALADSPDAFCSTLAAEQQRTPDAWAARLSAAVACGLDCPLVAELAGAAVGLAWAKADTANAPVVHLFQVWVAPEGRGRGIAAALIRAAIAWARSKNAGLVELVVTCGDSAALRLYLREGFKVAGSPQPRPGTGLLEQTMRLALAERTA